MRPMAFQNSLPTIGLGDSVHHYGTGPFNSFTRSQRWMRSLLRGTNPRSPTQQGKTREAISLFVRSSGNLGEPRLLGYAGSINPPTRTNDFAGPRDLRDPISLVRAANGFGLWALCFRGAPAALRNQV